MTLPPRLNLDQLLPRKPQPTGHGVTVRYALDAGTPTWSLRHFDVYPGIWVASGESSHVLGLSVARTLATLRESGTRVVWGLPSCVVVSRSRPDRVLTASLANSVTASHRLRIPKTHKVAVARGIGYRIGDARGKVSV